MVIISFLYFFINSEEVGIACVSRRSNYTWWTLSFVHDIISVKFILEAGWISKQARGRFITEREIDARKDTKSDAATTRTIGIISS